MEEFRLCNSDYRFMMLVWEHAPIGSGELVKLCAEKLGWKKSTTYTEIKRLCEKGVLQNEHAVVTPLVTQEEYQQQESINPDTPRLLVLHLLMLNSEF